MFLETAVRNEAITAARGGGKNAWDLSCASAGDVNLGRHFDDMGFRCCKDLP
jgi:hypothetical protein